MKAAFPHESIETELVQGDKGAFEVFLDGRKLFSKLALKRFPAYQELPTLLVE